MSTRGLTECQIKFEDTTTGLIWKKTYETTWDPVRNAIIGGGRLRWIWRRMRQWTSGQSMTHGNPYFIYYLGEIQSSGKHRQCQDLSGFVTLIQMFEQMQILTGGKSGFVRICNSRLDIHTNAILQNKSLCYISMNDKGPKPIFRLIHKLPD